MSCAGRPQRRPALPDLPNFLIVGAAKSGTTALYHLLQRHPEVFMPVVKEPHYFVRERVRGQIPNLVDDWESYAALFAGAGARKARGEASVLYLYYHEEAIAGIRARLGPDTRIIILLRNPVDRAYSAYQFACRFNRDENLSFEAALSAEEVRRANLRLSPMLHYRSMGLYSAMVLAYLQAFRNVHVILYDDLQLQPAVTLRSLCTFLGIDPARLDSSASHNVGGTIWKSAGLGLMVKRAAGRGTRAWLQRNAPTLHRRLKAFALQYMMKSAATMPPQVRAELLAYYRQDVQQLGRLLGRDLCQWLV